jgi:hypothetical protein
MLVPNPGEMAAMTHALPSGAQVRLRLPHRADRTGVAALCRRIGLHLDDVEATRVLRFDPRRRSVACAVAWTGDSETVVGVASMEHARDGEPDLVLCDPEHPGLAEVLERWLAEQAASRARRAA